MPSWPGVLLAVLATGLLGALLEALVLRRLYRRSELEQVLFTIGLTFLFVASANLLFGPEVQLIPLPPWLARHGRPGHPHPAGAAPAGDRRRRGGARRQHAVAQSLALRHLAARDGRQHRRGRRRSAFRSSASTRSPSRAGAALAGLGGILGAELMPLEPYYPVKYLVLVLVVVAVGGMGSIAGLGGGRRDARHHRDRQQVPRVRLGQPVLLPRDGAAAGLASARPAAAGAGHEPRRDRAGPYAAPAARAAARWSISCCPTSCALFSRIAIMAIFVMSLDLVVGYGGLATLGHAALFGAGAYAAGILPRMHLPPDPLARPRRSARPRAPAWRCSPASSSCATTASPS